MYINRPYASWSAGLPRNMRQMQCPFCGTVITTGPFKVRKCRCGAIFDAFGATMPTDGIIEPVCESDTSGALVAV